MILAPRSCPSRPGLATTTRYGRFTKAEVVRTSPATDPNLPPPECTGADRHPPTALAPVACGCPRSSVARSILAAIFVATWGIAAFISSGGAESTERLAAMFSIGSVEARAESIEEDGPLLFPGLNTTSGERTLVVDHRGDDPTQGWVVYWAYPADRDATCAVEQVRGTSTFVDCEGRQLAIGELAPGDGVVPTVENRTRLVLDLRGAVI